MPDYDLLCRQLDEVIGDERAALPALANFSALVYSELDRVNWAGFYLLNAHRLLLGPFQGKLACVSIPLGRGVCGTAAQKRETVIVPDVHAFEGHIACDADSRSEIVLPIIAQERLLGVLDVDSYVPDRFSQEDARGLSAMLRLLTDRTDIATLVQEA